MHHGGEGSNAHKICKRCLFKQLGFENTQAAVNLVHATHHSSVMVRQEDKPIPSASSASDFR